MRLLILLLFSSAIYASDFEVNRILKLDIPASINVSTVEYIEKGIKTAQKENFELILIHLNTPGGFLKATKEIITMIGSSPFPVALWITPEGASATSAGAIIASSAHLLYMNRGTNIGAATPVMMGKDIDKESDMRKKAISDLVALVRGLSQARNRNANAFATMIEKASSFSAPDALKKNIINQIATSTDELIGHMNNQTIVLKGKPIRLKINPNVEIEALKVGIYQKMLNIIADPTLTYILMMLGAALIYLEIQAAGGLVLGAVGVFFLLLSSIGFGVLPLSITSLLFILLAFILFILECFITSFGVLSLTGLAALIFGSLNLFENSEAFIQGPSKPVIYTISITIVFFMLLMGFYFFKTRRKKDYSFSAQGKVGIVTEDLDHGFYHVRVEGEIWKASCEKPLKIGQEVKIKKQKKGDLTLKL